MREKHSAHCLGTGSPRRLVWPSRLMVGAMRQIHPSRWLSGDQS
jgi:hypothetical protein